MERLTEYTELGNAITSTKIRNNGHQKCITKLARYEDTKLTPEEVQELKDKNTPKKPALEGDGYDLEGNLVLDEWLCPNCNTRYEVDYDDYDFCPNCGQRLDWNEEMI